MRLPCSFPKDLRIGYNDPNYKCPIYTLFYPEACVWRIGEILIQKKLITWEQLEDALSEQKQTRELTGEILIRKHYISEPLFYKTLADQYTMRFVDLKRTKINPKAIELIPRSVSEKFNIIPIEISQGALMIGISNPVKTWPEAELKKMSGLNEIRTVLCLPQDIREAIAESYLQQETTAQLRGPKPA